MSAPATETTQIPGYLAGTWDLDAVHSDISFTVRHLGVSRVRGRFGEVAATIVTAAAVTDSTVTATIAATSIDTGNDQRDEHVRAADFLDVTTFPTLTLRSTAVRVHEGEFRIDGALTLHGVTKPITLSVAL